MRATLTAVSAATLLLSATASAQTAPVNPPEPQTVPAIDINRPASEGAYAPLRQGAEAAKSAFSKAQPVLGNLLDAPISSLPSIADLVERVSQSTVNIIVTTENGEMLSEGQGPSLMRSAII